MVTQYAIDKNVAVNELRFHYRDWGGFGWPVLLLHGLASTAHSWDLVAPLLLDDARVIALDLRGHGQSDKPEGDYTFRELSKDVRGVFKALQLERPVIIGHSWGAWIGLWIAAHYPDELSGLVLVNDALVDLGKLGTWEATAERLKPPDVDGMPVEEFREMMRENSSQGLLTPAVEAALMANFEIDAEERIHQRLHPDTYMQILRHMWEQRLAELYEKITCPVLILAVRGPKESESSDLAAKEAGIEKAEELLADVVVEWIESDLDDVPLYHPHQLAEHIGAFLREQI